MNDQANTVIKKTIVLLEEVKEKIALAADTCCFSSVALDYDEFDEIVRELDNLLGELSQNLNDKA